MVVLFFRLCVRLFVLGFAYLIACLAAVFLLIIAIAGWRSDTGALTYASPEEEFLSFAFHVLFGVVSFSQIVGSMLTPAVGAILLTEAFSIRLWVFHVIGGGILALVLLLSADVYGGEIPPQQDITLALAVGFTGGLVYWVIAGRQAGNWRMRDHHNENVLQ